MSSDKINKESQSTETAQDKGVNSTELLKSDICLTCKLKQFSDLLSDIVITELNRRGRESLDEIGKFLTEKDHSDH